MKITEKCQARVAQIEAEMASITDQIEADDRLLDEGEKVKMASLQSEHAELVEQINLQTGVASAKAAASKPVRKVAPSAAMSTEKSRIFPGEDKNCGFKNIGEYMITARSAQLGQPRARERLMAALSVYGNETTDADGGIVVPGEFPQTIDKFIYGVDSLASRVTRIPITQNSIKFPVDNNGPWDAFSGSSGSAIISEAGAYGQVKPLLSSLTINVEKRGFILPITDELLEDSGGALTAYVNSKAEEVFTYDINQVLLSGTGEVKSFIASAACVTASSGSGQSANTIISSNINTMYRMMVPSSRGNAVWLVSAGDAEAQLDNMGFPASGTATYPLYMPAGSIAGQPFATLKGRPVIVLPNLSALGDVGDIVFADLSKYWLVTKGGVRADSSIHLWFDQGVSAFRFSVRMGGNTRLQSAITLPNSSVQGHFVTLAAR